MNFKELNTKQAVKDYINNNWWFSTMKLNLFNEENNKLDISEKLKIIFQNEQFILNELHLIEI